MNARTLGLLLLLLLLCGLLFLLYEQSFDGPPAPEAPPPVTDPPLIEEPPADLPPDPAGGSGPERPDAVAKVPPTKDDDKVAIQGTVTVADEAGAAHRGESGSFTFFLWRESRARHLEVQVTDGRFSTNVSPDVRLQAVKLVLGGRPTVVLGFDKPIDIPPGGRVDIAARWPRPLVLHVQDAETGAELTDVTVLRVSDWERKEMTVPGQAQEGETAATGARSPVVVPPTPEDVGTTRRIFFAKAPGYAWGRIEIDTSAGGDRRILLAPGGDLVVKLTGDARDPGLLLRVRSADMSVRQPWFEAKVADAEAAGYRVEGLPGGPCLVSAELGEWFQKPVTVAQTKAVVVPGEAVEVTLELAPTASVELVTLSGILEVPAEWGKAPPSVTLRLRGAARGGAEDRHLVDKNEMKQEGQFWHFAVRKVLPGTWDLSVSPYGYHTAVEVAPGGDADVRLSVPPPARVTVHVLDSATGKPIPLKTLDWRPVDDEGKHGGESIQINRAQGADRFVFSAPPGRIQLWLFEDGYEFAVKSITIVPGENEHTIRLAPTMAIKIVLMDGDTPVPWPEDAHPDFTHVGGQGRSTGSSWGEDGTTFFVDTPGLYRAKIPDIEGYLPVPEQEVRVEKGKVTRHPISLTRKR